MRDTPPPSTSTASPGAARLRASRAGLLIAADPPLMAIVERAGGAVGKALPVPPLAAIVALSATLDLPIARTVTLADGARDIVLDIEARPAGDEIVLTSSGAANRDPRASWLEASTPTAAAPGMPWRWRSDAELILTEVDFAPGDHACDTEAELVGRPLTRLVRLIEDTEGDLPIIRALAAGEGFTDQRAVRRDQPEREIVLSAQPLKLDGRLTGFAGTGGAPVRSVAVDRPGFARHLGTALRQPLDRIVARADSIAAQTEGPLRRDYADYAGDIASAARHLLALVEDMADAETIEQPDFAITGEAIDLADLARRAAGLLQVRAAAKSVRIDRPAPGDTQPAQGDFRRVLQILVNIVGNAVRYSPTGSSIWLRVEAQGDTAVVIVADQGKGIDPADHARVFEKFERVDSSEPGGSGLGLYISRALARAMGGDITLDSAPGQGARFILTLPVG